MLKAENYPCLQTKVAAQRSHHCFSFSVRHATVAGNAGIMVCRETSPADATPERFMERYSVAKIEGMIRRYFSR